MARKFQLLWMLLLAGSCACAVTVSAAEQKPTANPDDPLTVIGSLTCSLTGVGEGVASGVGRDMICRFQPGQQGPEETYLGSVQGVGKADLLFGRGAVLLSVKGPVSMEVTPGMLTQNYAADAGSSGSSFAPLVGERNKAILLQPLAEQAGRVSEGKTQPDAVIILVELKLQSSPA